MNSSAPRVRIGECVHLRCGGFSMVVVKRCKIRPNGIRGVKCKWHDDCGRPRFDTYPLECLEFESDTEAVQTQPETTVKG